MEKAIKEWLTKKELDTISKWTINWFKYSKEYGQECEEFNIYSDYKIPKSYLLNQLDYLLNEEDYENTKEEENELKAIIERVKNDIK